MEIQDLLAELLSGDDERADDAALALAQHPQKALPELYKLLDAPDSEHRWWAIRTIAGCETAPQTTPYLLAALEDTSSEVRQCAALALCHRPDPQAILPLIKALSDPDPMVASLASSALAILKKEAVPALMDALKTEISPQAQRQALRALAEIADPRAIPALMKAIQGNSALMKYWAEHGLNKLGLGMVYLKP